MRDQAESLRLKIQKQQKTADTKVIAVLSGKGGVGKSNFSLNFSLALSQRGHKVLLFDMDIGMGNIDILLGSSGGYTFIDIFEKNVAIQEVIRKGPVNLSFVSGGTGLSSLFKMDSDKFNRFTSQLDNIISQYDYVIFDMGAGMTEDSLQLLMSAQELIVLTTPEPTSITDAYAAMKYICLRDRELPLQLVVNRSSSEKEGSSIINRLSLAMQQFMQKQIVPLGYLPDDKLVSKAVIRQTPFILLSPEAKISKSLNLLTDRYLANEKEFKREAAAQNTFISKLRRFFFER